VDAEKQLRNMDEDNEESNFKPQDPGFRIQGLENPEGLPPVS
jgi:hypothetical protein